MTKVVICGFGYVGKGMQTVFPEAAIYDPPAGYPDLNERRRFAELAIICVPTPSLPDGRCDTSIVEQVIRELPEETLILIKSTVPPGTTDRLRFTTGRRLVFSPEYMGEGGYWVPPEFPDPRTPLSHRFMILGGDPPDCTQIADIFARRMGPATRFRFMRAAEAEAVKYFENAFLALKVVYANEMRRFCDEHGLNYYHVREGWLDDPRVGVSHSLSFAAKRFFDGKCLPKDLNALRAIFESPLLEGVANANEGNRV